jgi:hypothetical protein
MNEKRTNFIFPSEHQIQITPYWLLGFSEGEANFGVNKTDLSQVYAIDQIYHQKAIIESIKVYLFNLCTNLCSNSSYCCKPDTLSISDLPARNSSQPKTIIYIRNINYISNVLIPFLDNLTFFSKKGLDYKDWRNIALLRLDNKHFTSEGKLLISHLCNRMNKNRLSSNLERLNKSNQLTMAEIELRVKTLLQKQKSGVWVFDKDVLVVGSPFPNITKACKALGVGPRSSYLDNGKLVQKRFKFYSSPRLVVTLTAR